MVFLEVCTELDIKLEEFPNFNRMLVLRLFLE